MTHTQSVEEERVAVNRWTQGYSSTNHDGRRMLSTWLPVDVRALTCQIGRSGNTSETKRCTCIVAGVDHLPLTSVQLRLTCIPYATPNFLNCIVTEDESWCLKQDPETKRQSIKWRSPASPRQKMVRAEKARVKTMLITFLDIQGIVHKEFLPEGTTMNAARYIEILTRFMKRLRRYDPSTHKVNPLTGYLPPEKLFRKRLTLILRFPSKMQHTSFLSPF
ncbi:mariner Mos1 transposase [Trichonephila clavipes]|nr:mariner Mos1 transposase [Trichonephila clavipes]